jgi:hypothetical protein
VEVVHGPDMVAAKCRLNPGVRKSNKQVNEEAQTRVLDVYKYANARALSMSLLIGCVLSVA